MKKLALLLLALALSGTAHAQNEIRVMFEGPTDYVMAGWRGGALSADSCQNIDESVCKNIVFKQPGRFDANGDGTDDLIMVRRDDQDNLQDMLVALVDLPGDQAAFWRIENIPAALGCSPACTDLEFVGFADPDDDGNREALFNDYAEHDRADTYVYERTGLDAGRLDWQLSAVSQHLSKLLAVMDLTGDGVEELVIGVLDAETGDLTRVQVWGSSP